MNEELLELDAKGYSLYYEPSFKGFVVKGRITGGIYVPEISFGRIADQIYPTREEALQAGIDYLKK